MFDCIPWGIVEVTEREIMGEFYCNMLPLMVCDFIRRGMTRCSRVVKGARQQKGEKVFL